MPSDYEKICKDNIRRRGEEFDDIGRLISEQLYSDRSHFVYELLQNAEDALARRFQINPNDSAPRKVQFRLFHNRLEFRHYGALFNEEDVKGISDVLKGTKKEDYIQIGKFGIGFKSVYAFTATPEIHSGEEHFIIRRFVRPEATTRGFSIAESETVFNFPFDHEELSIEVAYDLILTKLRGLGPRVLLFLKWINEIEWSVEPDGEKGQYLKESVEVESCENARRTIVVGQNNGKDECENWLVFERFVKVHEQSQGYRNCVPVEIGFLLETNEKNKTESIAKIKNSQLVVFFPTEKATRLGFLIQGPYKTTPSRDNILLNDDWNKTLVRETAHLLTDALPRLKQLGLLTVSLLEALPIRMDDFPEDSMFYPIVVAVRETLINEELLPADDGTFVSAKNAKLASADWLLMLLRKEQLYQLFKTDIILKWISGEITEGSKHDLWKYMREELKVEEVTPDSFARRIDQLFLENQTDIWMIELYRQLAGQKALWKKRDSHPWRDNTGPLRAKPFIRLQDGRHVKPFRADESPNAYLAVESDTDTSLPIVMVAISQHEDAHHFLKELGIPELDIVEEVIEKLLPKYSTHVPIDEHRRDIEKIVRAYTTDSQEKKGRLKERLRATSFILTERPAFEATCYHKPTETYFKNDDLMTFFCGNDTVGFVTEGYTSSARSLFKDLGVSDVVRVKRKAHNTHGHVSVKDYHGWHERGLNEFDPDIEVEGLDHATVNPNIKKSEFIWNNIALPYAACIRGSVETSTKQTFENSKIKLVVSNFGNLLSGLSWLPRSDGSFVRPGEISIDELPQQFLRNERLADQLCMKRDVVAKLAEEVGIPTEDIDLLRKFPEEFSQWKAQMVTRNEKPEFPTRTVKNPGRRQERLAEQLANAPEKKYEERERSVRITRGAIDQSLWLREQYTNDAGQMVCQICKEEMPFRKRDGEYYCEAVEALSKVYFSKEHEAQFLALCPLCAAMYTEFVKLDECAMKDLNHTLKNSEEPEVSLNLGELKTSIRFVESHFSDIKTILKIKGDGGE